MSDHSSGGSHIKTYLAIGAALLVGTALTVLAAKVHLGGIVIAIIIAIIIASVKGGLVAGYFMHLLHERKPIYWLLALTAVFFIAMIGLVLWTQHDQQGVPHGVFQVPARQPAAAHHEPAGHEAGHETPQPEAEHVP